jgi:hypothetical protein
VRCGGVALVLARRDQWRRRNLERVQRTDAASHPVRLLGVSVHNLEDPTAPFEPEEPLLPF